MVKWLRSGSQTVVTVPCVTPGSTCLVLVRLLPPLLRLLDNTPASAAAYYCFGCTTAAATWITPPAAAVGPTTTPTTATTTTTTTTPSFLLLPLLLDCNCCIRLFVYENLFSIVFDRQATTPLPQLRQVRLRPLLSVQSDIELDRRRKAAASLCDVVRRLKINFVSLTLCCNKYSCRVLVGRFFVLLFLLLYFCSCVRSYPKLMFSQRVERFYRKYDATKLENPLYV